MKNILFFAILTGGAAVAFTSELPIPPDSPQRLFYIQKSNNAHTVVYDANFLPGNTRLNPREPVRVYWIRYADQGQVQELTYMQRKLAYGVETRPTPDGHDMMIVAFRKRLIHIRALDRRPLATMVIRGSEARLKRVFVQLADLNCVVPQVAYVDLYGTDLATGQSVHERFIP